MILTSIDKEYIESCHDVSEGGIGICLSEMSIGGDVGAEVDLSKINPKLRSDFKLFSESNTRWIIEVKYEIHKEFETLMKKHNSPIIKIGSTKVKSVIINDNNKEIVNLGVSDIRAQWKEPIWSLMG